MDVLSDVITVMRTGRPHSARVRRTGSFGRRFQPFDGAGFHLVLAGRCWFYPPSGEPVALGPGELVFLPKGAAHGLADGPDTPLAPAESLPDLPDEQDDQDDQDGTVLVCGAYLLDRARTHPLLDELPDVIHMSARAGRPGLRAAVDLLDLELDQGGPGTDALVPALLDVLLLHVLRAWFATHDTGWAAALRDPAVAAALSAIHGEPAGQWTVANLATRVGLSRAAFARRFAALVGQPPLTYLTWWRMTLAAKLLRESDAPLAAVAREVGYTSEFAFAHAFKRSHGEPPGRYRQQVTPPCS